MKQRFVNQKLGKRVSRSAELQKARNAAAKATQMRPKKRSGER